MSARQQADPFSERRNCRYRKTFAVLGAAVTFHSNSRQLIALASAAFGRLPAHRWSRQRPRLQVILRLEAGSGPSTALPAARLSSGAGWLCAHSDAGNFVLIDPARRAALVQVTRDRLRVPYLVRYECIEFAALTLAARVQQLVPLHAACVGSRGRGVLLLGESGAGKSTMTLACALEGLQLLSEDSVFAHGPLARLTGPSNYLHLRPSSLRLVRDARMRARLHRAPRIRRRSGVGKLEFDLRSQCHWLPPAPMKPVATVILSSRLAGRAPLLRPLSAERVLRYLRRTQGYATRQPGWPAFERALRAGGMYELRRGAQPADGARSLRELLARAEPR